jgi:hypothetical protein
MRIARVCKQPHEDSLSVCQRSGFASVLGQCFYGAGASKDAGVEKEARTSFPDASASIAGVSGTLALGREPE